MSDTEIRHVISPACDDAEYVREVVEAKRALELWTMEPGFQEKFLAAPEETLATYGLSIDVLSVQILCVRETALEYQKRPSGDTPRVVRRYRGFLQETAWRGRPACRSIPRSVRGAGGSRTAAGWSWA